MSASYMPENSASIFTKASLTIWRIGRKGGVPFGGYKKSGIGREEGMDEVLAYTQVKNVHVML